MRILVIGGTGKVGGRLVGKLQEHGAAVRVLTRNADRAASLLGNTEIAAADLTGDPIGCMAAFADVDAVFMLNRPTFEETAEGLLAVEIARSAGVSRFVYQSVFEAETLAHLPHVAPKIAIRNAVMHSGMEWTLLCPNHFFQNDQMVQASLAERDEYDLPVGTVGCSSVDAGDIAEAAAIVLTKDGHGGKSYPVVGPQVLTGEDCAAAWNRILGPPIRYSGDVDRWQAAMRPFMPAWLNYDLAMMYRIFGERGFVAREGDVAAVTALLSRAPRPYDDYVAGQAAEWGLIGP